MDLKVSSSKSRAISPSDSDSEEKEFSDGNDDDRNHKHRRKEMQSQSSEIDVIDQAFSRPFKKHYKPNKNGQFFRETDSQSSEGWKRFNNGPVEKDLYAFDKTQPGFPTFSRAPTDLSQRIRRDSWSRGSASQVVHQGSYPPSLFPGGHLPNVSNAQIAPWNAFGYTQGLTNGGMNFGISRQRCRDFEERGFCLRGDMCPMEHGVNRIVVEDVQSLSQFNLPVSVPSGHLMGATAGPGSTLSINARPTTSMSSKVPRKSDKPEMVDIGMGLDCSFPGSTAAGDADLYDPDQPLLNNDRTEMSSQLPALNTSKMDESDSLVDGNPSYFDSRGTSFAVQGRRHSCKSRPQVKRSSNSDVNISDQLADAINEDQELLTNAQGIIRQDKPANTEDVNFGSKISRKPSQKATRTLFLRGIPEKSNKREALLLHFRKFGEVIDIYIPSNTQRAFVQFSQKEEAEAALKSPDAVMGNRFIKLLWANRDNIPGDCISNPLFEGQGKDRVHSAPWNITNTNAVAAVPKPSVDLSKHVITSTALVPQTSQKKLASLETLKEELRKKQEILDQKRNEFKLQLRKLETQASGLKNEEAIEQPMKRHKAGTTSDFAISMTLRPSGATLVASPNSGRVIDNKKVVDTGAKHSSTTTSAMVTHESTSLKQYIHPSPPATSPFSVNRFKLDNRPTTFRIISPLPAGLDNLSVLKEHFSYYGDLSNVELEDQETEDKTGVSGELKNYSARVTFSTRPSAEKAFKNGKCWEGHNLQFTWLASKSSSDNGGSKHNSLSAPKKPIDVHGLREDNKACDVTPPKVVPTPAKVYDVETVESSIDQVEAATKILLENDLPRDDSDAAKAFLEQEALKDHDDASYIPLEKESPER